MNTETSASRRDPEPPEPQAGVPTGTFYDFAFYYAKTMYYIRHDFWLRILIQCPSE
jgi:hypothetical protein